MGPSWSGLGAIWGHLGRCNASRPPPPVQIQGEVAGGGVYKPFPEGEEGGWTRKRSKPLTPERAGEIRRPPVSSLSILLRCVVPCHAVLGCAVLLCCALLCHTAHAMPCYAVLCYAMLCYASLRCVSAVSAVSELDALGSNARAAYTCETQGAPVPPLIATNCPEFRPRSD